MADAVSPDARSVAPEGVALAIMVVSPMFLGLSVLAVAARTYEVWVSISTIARAPFITRYEDPDDNLKYYIGYIVLFSNIESGIGCVATSLPAIRRLYMRLANKENSVDGSEDATPPKGSAAKTLVTIGGGGSAFNSRARLARGVSLVTVQAKGGSDGDWEQFNDGEEDEMPLSPSRAGKKGTSRPLKGIRADYTYSVELEPVRDESPGP